MSVQNKRNVDSNTFDETLLQAREFRKLPSVGSWLMALPVVERPDNSTLDLDDVSSEISGVSDVASDLMAVRVDAQMCE
eukprot:7423316-Karenia_brevis.AAC.1